MVIRLCNQHKSTIENLLNKIKKNSLDSFSFKYENFLLMGDFNSQPTEKIMSDFMESYNLKDLVFVSTCGNSSVKFFYGPFLYKQQPLFSGQKSF